MRQSDAYLLKQKRTAPRFRGEPRSEQQVLIRQAGAGSGAALPPLGFVGDRPFTDPVDGLLDTVAAASIAALDLSQGDVVVDENDVMMVVASGRGFNATAGGDTLRGISAE
jgi:hypothetical protein